jgi:hypothetical protein
VKRAHATPQNTAGHSPWVEVSIQTITAVGEATASDPSYSEVKLLRIRMEQGDGDYANSMYPGIEYPA